MSRKSIVTKKRHQSLFDDYIQQLRVAGSIDDISFGKLMREHGYSDGYAHNPQKLWQTETWQELIDKIPEDLLLAKTMQEAMSDTHKRNATKNRKMLFDIKGRFTKKIRLGELDESLEDITDYETK